MPAAFPVHMRGRWDEVPEHVPHARRGRPSIRERFAQFVSPEPNTGCWLWMGAVLKGPGYGEFHLAGVPVLAHRLSYEMEVGPIPDGLVIDHLCRNKLCVNPRHLEPVPYSENFLRGHHSANDLVLRDFCKRGHPRTPENTPIWSGVRRCRQCNLDWQRAHPNRGKRKHFNRETGEVTPAPEKAPRKHFDRETGELRDRTNVPEAA